MYLSSNLTYLRRAKKTSQAELAELLNVTNSAISGYEKGRNTPTFKNFLKLANFFQINLHDFVYNDLSVEGYNPKERIDIAEPATRYGSLSDREALQLCLHRIRQLERFVREVAPDRADEIGVEV